MAPRLDGTPGPTAARPRGGDRYVALVRSAQRAFATKGYAAASTDEIAQAAGVSKSLVFRHFGSKAGLFGAAVVDPFLSFVEDFSAEWESEPWSSEPLDATTYRFVSVLYDRMRTVRPLLIALLSVSLHRGGSGEDLQSVHLELQRLVDRISEEHLKATQRFSVAGLDPPLTVRITFGLVFAMAVLDGWLVDTMPVRPSRRRVVDELSGFVVGALTRPSPTQLSRSRSVSGRRRPDNVPAIATAPITELADPQHKRNPGADQRRAWGTAPQELLLAAAELFAAKGYAATSTKEVAQRSGVAESLLFWHFPTKNDLFTRAVFEPFLRTVESFTGEWGQAEWKAQPLEETTRMFIVKLYDWMRADRALLIAMIHSSILEDEAGPTFPEVRRELRQLFARIEEEHVKARQFHGLGQLDPPLTVRITFGAVLAVAIFDDWLLTGANPTLRPQRIVDELVGYLTAAALRPSHEQLYADRRSPT